MKNVIESLKFKEIPLDEPRMITYLVTYRLFMNHFVPKERKYTNDDYLMAIVFAYSWMPTIPKIDKEKLNNLEPGFFCNHEKIKNNLETLKTITNNSMVGTSKALHFMYPDKYPIWDSNIYKYLNSTSSSYGLKKIENYITYIDILNDTLIGKVLKDEIKSIKSNKLMKDVSDFRALEFLIFLNAKEQN